MKRILPAIFAAVLLFELGGVAIAQLGWFQYKNWMFIGSPCVSYAPYPPPVLGAVCSDTANGALYTWRGTAFVLNLPTATVTATATATATATRTATATATPSATPT